MGSDFSNKVALVTGAGKGIGRACALQLAAQGAEVIAVARTASDLDSLAAEAIHGRIKPLVMDATHPDLLDYINGLAGLDILVNNLGTNRPQPFVEASEENLDLLIAVNIRTAFTIAQAAAKKMVAAKTGVIIHMSSQMGHVGAANRTVYCMTKHAIEGLSKAMAVELAPEGVRVNTVAPTFIETPMTKPMFENSDFASEVLSKIPLGHVGHVDDVAHAVCYLASDQAKMVTGTSLRVDGGWTAV